ncbi:MAG: hypothetical protein Q8Q09_26650 [Deltaproteobacteria bacterium]|nr:hypothetical protein [Deltaproteobacteria bacterium]
MSSDPPRAETETTTPAVRRREKEVRALPVIALCVILVTAAIALWAGQRVQPTAGRDPTPVVDVDHYVSGTPAAVCERFLRAWMRQQYEVARDLATGSARDRAVTALRSLDMLTTHQQEELARTQAFTRATHYDLEHIELRDLSADAQGRPRKQVLGQAHAYGSFPGTRVDSRRGQTFTVVQIDGAWRVSDRQWERLTSDTRDGGPAVAVSADAAIAD